MNAEDGLIRRLGRRARSLIMDRVLGFGPMREGIAALRRDQDVLAHRLGQLNDHLRALSDRASRDAEALGASLDEARILAALGLASRVPAGRPITEAEFRVFSQWGEDGIIQHLLRHVDACVPTFVEFGVEDYREANTRFLLISGNWRGLVIDGSLAHVDAIQRDAIYWRHDLTAVCAFINAENINDLVVANGFSGDIGLLSIDIDGNDYWVWKAMSEVDPVIVVIEYNSVLGSGASVSIPYDPAFTRTAAHPSNLYFGASLRALVDLGRARGYAFVGCNSAGNNAFFVRRDRLRGLRELSVEEGYVVSRFRESRNGRGELTYLSGASRAAEIADLPLVNVATGEYTTVGAVTHSSSA